VLRLRGDWDRGRAPAGAARPAGLPLLYPSGCRPDTSAIRPLAGPMARRAVATATRS